MSKNKRREKNWYKQNWVPPLISQSKPILLMLLAKIKIKKGQDGAMDPSISEKD